MKRRVVVTGLGVVSPLGCSVNTFWNGLLRGNRAVQPLLEKEFNVCPKAAAARVNWEELNLNSHATASEQRTLSCGSLYALVAGAQALSQGKWPSDDESGRERTAVVVGAGMGDLAGVVSACETLSQGGKVGPYFVPRILASAPAGTLSLRHGLKGPLLAPATACAAGLHAIGDGFRLIQYGDADLALCGAAEAAVVPLAVAGFSRLRALSSTGVPRPFDIHRDGFVIGEGAAMVLLEDEEHAKSRNIEILAEVIGLGLSGDAAHPTAPPADGHGAALAMKRALSDAGIAPKDVGLVAAHAAGTPLGDAAELTAVRSVFNTSASKVSITSSKGAHGHLLGAAGALESVSAIMAVSNQVIPPTCGLEKPCDEAEGLKLVYNEPLKWQSDRRIALKNSFGFGGMNASLIISSYVS